MKEKQDILNQKSIVITITMMDRQTLFFPPPYGTLGCIPVYPGMEIVQGEQTRGASKKPVDLSSLKSGDRIIFKCCEEIFAEGAFLFLEHESSNLRSDMKAHVQRLKIHWMPVSYRGIEHTWKMLHPDTCVKCMREGCGVVNTYHGISEIIRQRKCKRCDLIWVTVEKTVCLNEKQKPGPKVKNDTLDYVPKYSEMTRPKSKRKANNE